MHLLGAARAIFLAHSIAYADAIRYKSAKIGVEVSDEHNESEFDGNFKVADIGWLQKTYAKFESLRGTKT